MSCRYVKCFSYNSAFMLGAVSMKARLTELNTRGLQKQLFFFLSMLCFYFLPFSWETNALVFIVHKLITHQEIKCWAFGLA